MGRLVGGSVNPEALRGAKALGIMKRWEEVVGENLAKKSWPFRFVDGTIWVAFQGSAWAYELHLRWEGTIRPKLNAMAGDPNLFVAMRLIDRPLPPREEPIEVAPVEPEKEPDDLAGLSIREIAARRLALWRKDEEGA